MKTSVLFSLLSLGYVFCIDNLREAEGHIRDHLKSFSTGAPMCAGVSCCNVTSSESCPLSNMAKDKTTLVLPGGQTRCIFSDSSPFAFQVVPGASDKLLFYFQGGGACWDEYSTKVKMCTTDASPQQLVGIFDRSNALNRFRDHTIVHVLYCSGDVHGGNVVRPYADSLGVPVQQTGLANSQSALDWVTKQMAAGALASRFSELVVMGCSAGSIGAQLWANEVLSTLPHERAAVVPDSYAGVFPAGTVGPLIYGYGFCTASFLDDALRAKCNQQALELTELDEAQISKTPSVPYAFLQSKVDIVQQSFYVAIALSMNCTKKTINPTEFYGDVTAIFGGYNGAEKNFLTYLVDGDHHCFTNQALYYTADPQSSTDNGATTKSQMMYSFVNALPLSEGQTASTVCDGTVQVQGRLNDNTYCSSTVVPKSFTEHY